MLNIKLLPGFTCIQYIKSKWLMIWLQIAIQLFALSHYIAFVIMYVSPLCLTKETENSYADQTYVSGLELHQNYEQDFAKVKLV